MAVYTCTKPEQTFTEPVTGPTDEGRGKTVTVTEPHDELLHPVDCQIDQ